MLKNKFIIYIASILIISLLAACGGGGGGNGAPSSPSSSNTPSVSLSSNQGQALLGPIVNADVFVYDAELIDGAPVCSETTTDLSDSQGPGIIDLSDCDIESDKLYFIIVKGGDDIDADDDGILDATPTPKQGALRGIYKGEDLLAGGWRVNILTEVAYNGVVDSLLTGAEASELISRLEFLASSLLNADLNNDGVVNYTDLTAFVPITDADKLLKQDSELLDRILNAVLYDDRSQLTVLAREYLLSSLAEFEVKPNDDSFHSGKFVVDDNYLYVLGTVVTGPETDAFNYSSLRIFDIRDLTTIEFITEFELEGINSDAGENVFVSGFKKSGENIFMSVSGLGVFNIDVSDAANPVLNTMYTDTKNISSMDVKGDILAFSVVHYSEIDADDDERIVVLDITDLSAVQELEVIDQYVIDIKFDEHYMYVLGHELSVYDLSEPSDLYKAGDGALELREAGVDGLEVRDGFAYVQVVGNETQGIDIYDMRDPSNIIFSSSVNTGGSPDGGRDFLIDGDYLFTKNTDAITTYDISNPGSPVRIDSRSTLGWFIQTNSNQIYSMNFGEVIVYAKDSLKENVQNFAALDTDNPGSHIVIDDSYAYIAGGSGLTVVDITAPNNGLNEVSQEPLFDLIEDITLQDDIIYIANHTEGLVLIDVSDPTDPTYLSNDLSLTYLPEGGSIPAVGVAVKDTTAYLALPHLTSIGIYDVSDPNVPLVVNQIDHETPDKLTTYNDLLVTHGFYSDTIFYDISDEVNPEQLYIFIGERYTGLRIVDDFMYATSDVAGLSIYDISSPSEPILYGEAKGLGVGNAVDVSGDVAYVANDFGFVDVYDVSDLTEPIFVAQIKMNGTVKDLAVNDQYIFAVNLFGVSAERIASTVRNLN